MKKLLLYILSLFILAACSNEIPEYHQPVQAKRVILAYLIANNNLDNDIMKNVLWMYESLTTAQDSCTLLIYYKPNSTNKYLTIPEILEFQTNGYGQINNKEILSGDKLTIENVLMQAKRHQAVGGVSTNPLVMENNIRIMQNIAPAKSYGLLFGSHATGWMPAPNIRETFSFGIDGSEYNSINIPEKANALRNCFSNNLDFILFDACMMGIAEIYYEFQDVTKYCIASVMETPRVGFPYHRFFHQLYEEEINFQQICDEIIAFNKENDLWGTYAAIDCSQMGRLAEAIRYELLSHNISIDDLSHNIQQYGTGDFTYFSFDIKGIVESLNKGSIPPQFQEVLDNVVIAKSCIDDYDTPPLSLIKDKNNFCGIGMYIPNATGNTTWDNYYRSSISWYNAVGWSEIIPSNE